MKDLERKDLPGVAKAPAGPLLPSIVEPGQLKRLTIEDLQRLAAEIRKLIICTVSKNGGHLAPNLGTVELTLALHRVFESPQDRIVWDVGHQSYTHKIITGRQGQFHTIRQFGGLSGFPKREESRHDAFGTGHASTSISAALGMAAGKYLKGSQNRAIAVIGDGGMTGGMAFEALNHAGDLDRNLIVVLNDNEMSIAPNVGALSAFLSRKLTTRTLRNLKREVETVLNAIPRVGPDILSLLKKSEESLRAFFTPGLLFQAFEFTYIGPIKGHDLPDLVETFEAVREIQGPVLVHVLTKKGMGYSPAECDPTRFHGVGSFDVETGTSCKVAGCAPAYMNVFGETLTRLAESDPRVCAITAAMPQGTGLDGFAKAHPERFFDVGIAEQHAVTFAAGLAVEGYKPVLAVYSTFLQRALDQVIHDVCLQNLPVVFALDRGGLVGDDGPTHHGVFDLSFLRQIPNMVVMVPADENELRHMLKTAIEYQGPIALRYPRGAGTGAPPEATLRAVPIGKGVVLRKGDDLAIFAVGIGVPAALAAAERLAGRGVSAAVVNARFVKPLDRELILWWARKTGRVLTVEENVLAGGFGSAVLELFEEEGWFPRVRRLGLPDAFIPHGTQKQLRALFGLDAEAVERAAVELMQGAEHGKAVRAV